MHTHTYTHAYAHVRNPPAPAACHASHLLTAAAQVSNAAWSLAASGQYQPAAMDSLVDRAYALLAQHFQHQHALHQRSAAGQPGSQAVGPPQAALLLLQGDAAMGPRDRFNGQVRAQGRTAAVLTPAPPQCCGLRPAGG